MRFLHGLPSIGLLILQACETHAGTEIRYPLKDRKDQGLTTTKISLLELKDYALTFSEDSEAKALEPFLLTLFETDGLLPLVPSLFNVETALNQFIEAELNAAYGSNNLISNVKARVLSQKSTVTSGRMRALQVTGSELEVQVNVTFANDPSPETSLVETSLKDRMQNMRYFLNNLTETAAGDRELENVHSAFRLEMADDGDTDRASADFGETGGTVSPVGIQTDGSPETRDRGDPKLIVPLVFAVCVATLVAGAFIVRKKAVAHENISQDPSYPSYPGVDVMWDEESDIFSFETALIDSPMKVYPSESESPGGNSYFSAFSARKQKQSGSVSSLQEERSDAFSGLAGMKDIPLGSPNSSVPGRSPISEASGSDDDQVSDVFSGIYSRAGRDSMFGLFQSKTSGSVSTVVASNKTKDRSGVGMATAAAAAVGPSPGSRATDLFTFSEEDEEDILSSAGELVSILSGDDTDPIGAAASFGDLHQSGHTDYISSDGDTNGGTSTDGNGIELYSTRADDSSFIKKFNEGNQSNRGKEWEPLKLATSDDVLAFSVTSPPNSMKSKARSEGTPRSRMSKPFDEETPRRTSGTNFETPETAESPVNMQPLAYGTAVHRPCTDESSSLQFRDFSKGQRGFGSVRDEFENGIGGWSVSLKPVAGTPRATSTPDNSRSPASTGRKLRRSQYSTPSTEKEPQVFSDPGPSKKRKNVKFGKQNQIQLLWDREIEESPSGNGRRHAKSTAVDGSANYQTQTMDPQEWSLTSLEDTVSYGSNNVTDTTPHIRRSQGGIPSSLRAERSKSLKVQTVQESVGSPGDSTVSALSAGSTAMTDNQKGRNEAQTSKQLISDLVWLEKKIAGAKNTVVSSPDSEDDEAPYPKNRDTFKNEEGSVDSLSFRSMDNSLNGSDGSILDIASPRAAAAPAVAAGLQSILCRDCYAPPGKLKIVIHSTKDGPAVHTVKEGSSLQGHIFPGDLIISVDNVDTRSYTAEQVMKMMTARTRHERKITVLHFEEGQEL